MACRELNNVQSVDPVTNDIPFICLSFQDKCSARLSRFSPWLYIKLIFFGPLATEEAAVGLSAGCVMAIRAAVEEARQELINQDVFLNICKSIKKK